MTKAAIPSEVKAKVQALIDEFNQKHFRSSTGGASGITGYSARFKGRYLYLDRNRYRKPSPICRLTWNGEMDNWDFAIYKYSSEYYDPGEIFPGMGHVDGTVTGAMLAGMEAYP